MRWRHDGRWVALARTPRGRVGVDLTDPADVDPGLAAEILAPAERDLVRDADRPARAVLSGLWALKEDRACASPRRRGPPRPAAANVHLGHVEEPPHGSP